MQSGQGRALTVVDLESGSFHEVIPHRDEELANPVFYGGYILYKSSRDGVVNIFAAEISTGQCYQVTAARFGADYPSISPDGSKLLYSDYTARGYNLAELPLDPTTWTRIDTVAPSSLGFQKNHHDYSAQIPGTQLPAAPYRPSLHLFDFHSWGFTGGPCPGADSVRWRGAAVDQRPDAVEYRGPGRRSDWWRRSHPCWHGPLRNSARSDRGHQVAHESGAAGE